MKKQKRERVKPIVKSFNCNNCGSPVEITAVGQTLNVVCPSCKSIIDANDPNFSILQKAKDQRKFTPYIPLKSRGKLKGVLWECIGFVVKVDSGYYWSEYLLFNPYNGYRWLVEVNGHWGFFKRIYNSEGEAGSSFSANYKGKSFAMFNDGIAMVQYVEGEFYWRIKKGDKTRMKDFIAPPHGLSVELSEHEENWTMGYHIEGDLIKKAFKIKEDLPYKVGIGQLQPSPFKETFKKMLKPMMQTIVALVVVTFVRYATAQNKVVFTKSFNHSQTDKKNVSTYKTDPFYIDGKTTNIKVRGSSNVTNAWIYIDSLLVDTKTQKGIPVPLEISYYRGHDWKEGSRSNSKFYHNIPSGEYYLSIQTQSVKDKYRRGTSEEDRTYRLEILRDVPNFMNFAILCGLILLFPFIALFRRYGFEAKRWENSDFSPYGD